MFDPCWLPMLQHATAKFILGPKASLPRIRRRSPSQCRSSRSSCPGIAAGPAGLWEVHGGHGQHLILVPATATPQATGDGQ